MDDERRRFPRIKVDLPARWEGVLDQEQAQVMDLSVSGCFVLTGGKVEGKELVRLEIDLPGQERSYFWAEVVYAADGIGFAVQFTAMEPEDQQRLVDFVNAELKKAAN